MTINAEKFVMHVDPSHQVLAWQIRGSLKIEEMPAIVDKIKKAVLGLKKGEIKLLIDLRTMVSATGQAIVFSKDVNDVWEELQKWCMGYCSKVAVLCNGPVMKMQMDRIGKLSGISEISKHFWDGDDAKKMAADAYAFHGIPGNQLTDSYAK